jgi:hypothetical protein
MISTAALWKRISNVNTAFRGLFPFVRRTCRFFRRALSFASLKRQSGPRRIIGTRATLNHSARITGKPEVIGPAGLNFG